MTATPSPAAADPSSRRFRDRLVQKLREKPLDQLILSGIVFLISVLLFGPVVKWMAQQTLIHEQLKHAFIVLGLAGYAVLMPRRYRLPVVMAFDSFSLGELALSFVILAASLWMSFTTGVLIGACLCISAWLLFVFGPRVRRPVTILLAVFAAYVLLMVSQGRFDWPLRAMAGSHAAWVLHHLGYQTSLSLANPENPLLLLQVNGRPFEVAAECNGFGMIGSTVLLAILLVARLRAPWFDRFLCVLLAAFLGSAANTLRIVAICMAAPYFPGHYHAMHEVIGTAFFWGVLALVWLLVKSGRPLPRSRTVKDRTS